MADETTTKILEIQVNYEKAIKGIAEYEKQIRDARKAQDDLKAALKDGTITQDQFDQSMAASKAVVTQLKNEQAALTKQVRKNIEAEQAASGSLVEWRANLSNLTAEYDRMSIAERQSEEGKGLQTKINNLTTAIKAEEEATQRFYRNVGNYENGVRDALTNMTSELTAAQRKYATLVATMGEGSKEAQEAKSKMEGLQYTIDFTTESTNKMNGSLYSFIPFGSQLAKLVPIVGTGFKGLTNGLKLATQGFKMVIAQAKAFIATPIGAILTAIAAIIAIFNAGLKGSEDNSNKLNKILAPLSRALSAVQNVLQKLIGYVLNLVGGLENVLYTVINIANFLTGNIFKDATDSLKDAIAESIEVAEREAKLAKDQRAFEVEEAKKSLEIAKLRKAANDASNADTNARLEAAKKANEIEQKLADERVRLATEEYNLAAKKAEWSDNSAEDNEELARLEAAKYKAEEEYYNNTMRLQSQQNALEKSIADERKQRNAEAAAAAKERASKELDAIRAAEDAMLSLLKDGADKQRKQVNLSYDRQIEDLKKRLKEEKNLTAAARDAINQTIAAKEQQRAQELEVIDRSISDQELKRKQQEIQLMLDAVKNGTEQEYQLKLQQIQLNQEADIAATETEIQNAEERERMKALIRAKYAEQEDRLISERNQKIAEDEQMAIDNMFTERMMQVEGNAVEEARIELERKKYELDNLHQMEGESNEAFIARQLAARKAYNDSKKKLANAEVEIEKAKTTAITSIMGTVGDAITKLSGENKAAAKMAKVIGLAEMLINQAVAISEAIRNAQQGDPYTTALRVAAAVASIVVGMKEAFSSMNSVKLARGGKVTGAGTATSDSIPAMLSNGEFVVNAAATRLFEPQLAAINNIGRGVMPPTDYKTVTIGGMMDDTLSGSLSASVSEIRPVVSVVDITEGINRVEVIDTLDTL